MVFSILFMACNTDVVSLDEQDAIATPKQSTIKESRSVRCPPPTITLSPCDMKMRFFITRFGNPDAGTYSYTITDINNIQVDSGNVSNADYTTPVLNYCQQYIFTMYDPCTGFNSQTFYSDGCGNVWLC